MFIVGLCPSPYMQHSLCMPLTLSRVSTQRAQKSNLLNFLHRYPSF
jgi:hypothetical protein